MSFYIYTGHESSSALKVISSQYNLGLKKPLKSHTYQMHIDDITAALIKFKDKKLTELDAAITNGLIIDFLLANLSNRHWGWYSHQNLYILDFWKKKSEDVRFVLIFDSPIRFLGCMIEQNLDRLDMNNNINEWVGYHEKMLNFFNQNSNRCILVEGSVAQCRLKDISKYMGLLQSGDIESITQNNPETSDYDLCDHIINEIIKKGYPRAFDVYSAMQKKSFIKTRDESTASIEELFSLIKNHREIEYRNADIQCRYDFSSAKALEKDQKIDLLTKNSQALTNEIIALKEQVISNKGLQAIDIEHKELLELLHDTQERLEKYDVTNFGTQRDIEHQSYTTDASKKQGNSSEFQPISIKPIGVVERIEQDLPYRLGSILVGNSKDVKSIAAIPNKLFQEYRNFHSQNQQSLPELTEYQDYEKSEKIKKHLSYKLGVVMVDAINSPKNFVSLPYSMAKEVISFKMGKKK